MKNFSAMAWVLLGFISAATGSATASAETSSLRREWVSVGECEIHQTIKTRDWFYILPYAKITDEYQNFKLKLQYCVRSSRGDQLVTKYRVIDLGVFEDNDSYTVTSKLRNRCENLRQALLLKVSSEPCRVR